MDWIIAFALGFLTDLSRSVLLPASTRWINRLIPFARSKENIETNIVILDIMGKLKSLGLDPALAVNFRADADKFLGAVTSRQEAFVENAIGAIEDTITTQTELNLESNRRAEIAREQMGHALKALETSGWMEADQIKALQEAQTNWESYATSQAEVAAFGYKGGSMAPLVYNNEIENLAVNRTGELKLMLEDMRERFGD